ncbi:multiple sugar transport system permease protein/putative aldouronate transport system permease protein [Paenibacillus phyllosphaerae]|uniref:Multiple sugar transport system permease protein/putative aldouronate transport system permease protein n=1 Tax=Paenibacillus phyllosphaerae TaxID=274593 RepID=A0A7W5B2Q5_9BACL|nr:carbohydrate ABC transporter permease [Paenibacillus phyllosphaerae]MBB3113094.1 multiple sugar transport system permease protein/putative aldouronate transport system permease protein [Paenibacillus phyllosphaerae]
MTKDATIQTRLFDWTLVIVLLLISFLCLLPLWYTLAVSLSEKSAASAGQVWLWPVGFNWNSYKQIMNDSSFFHSFWISIQRVVLGASITMIITTMMAYPLSRSARDFRLRNALMWILVFTLLFNGGLIPWYMTIKALGLYNTIWALVLGGGVPVFNVILIVNYFRNLPKELDEAALVDGAGPWRMLFTLYVPLAVPVLATVTLFTIVYHWNEFFHGLVLTSGEEHYPLQTYIQQLVVVIDTANMTEDQYKRLNELSNQTLNAAKIFIAMIPVLLVYPFLQRFFIHGITLGSVKE